MWRHGSAVTIYTRAGGCDSSCSLLLNRGGATEERLPTLLFLRSRRRDMLILVQINYSCFSICVLVRTCVLVDLWNVISRSPSTVPIQSLHLAKYSPNARMCSCSARFIEDASGGDLCGLGQPSIPECISCTNQLLLSFINSPTSTPTSFFPATSFLYVGQATDM